MILIGSNVLIRRHKKDEVTQGGIHLPTVVLDKAENKGVVLDIGPGRMLECGMREEMQLKPGDVVYWAKHYGEDITVGGEECVVVRQSDIACAERVDNGS